jgi:L-histidine N-alpha-methyltransferase
MESDISLYLPSGAAASPGRLRRQEAEGSDAFADAVLAGLSQRPRSIPCRFFYDARGSELFEEITKLEEYYPTRTETALLEAHGAEIASLAGQGRVLVEFGSGSSRKTSLLLSALGRVPAYVPIDIAAESLREAAEWLTAQHDGLTVVPVIADFTTTRTLPPAAARKKRLGFFSGSTIGNLTHNEASAFLANAARLLGPDGIFLVGVDLKKDPAILVPAYDDSKGVTAQFNLNLLARINRELGGTFELSRFAHEAIYNEAAGRIEIYIRSLAEQIVRIKGRAFAFSDGERIHTENSHKYTIGEFQALARRAGWKPVKAWTDGSDLFSLHLLKLS